MNRLNLFYVLALLPLLLVVITHLEWLFAIFVPVYGFILVLIKRNDLSSQLGSEGVQSVLGILIAGSSFFLYYALVPFFESPSFYGGVNYAVYLFGLFLIFFKLSALREAFSPIFLLLAASSVGIVSQWLEHYFSWYVPHFVQFIVVILNMMGFGAETRPPDAIMLPTADGRLILGFVWGCVGVNSMLLFSILLVVMLFEESARLRTKFLWAVVGFLGVFLMNVIRLVIIFVADIFYGSSVGGQIHYFIGYVLFFLWLVIFLYTFSKRRVLSERVVAIWRRLRPVAGPEKTS
ncbi:MAG: exosortase/archaeosortase family protein [Candidatus Bathyarchaeota archaeon]|nr:MAG: exosortase/archaeosortase family protein [Candidatus Bathyarchaeota archaeon]